MNQDDEGMSSRNGNMERELTALFFHEPITRLYATINAIAHAIYEPFRINNSRNKIKTKKIHPSDDERIVPDERSADSV